MGPDLRPLEPIDAERAGYGAAWTGASGGDVHRLGLWSEGALVGAVQLTPNRRLRRAHVGTVELRAEDPAAAGALLGAVAEYADRWTALDRLQLDVPAGTAADGHGFEVEVRRRDQRGPGLDGLTLGRLRPGFRPRAPGPPGPWPARHHRAPVEVTLRPLQAEDAAGMQALSTEASAVWGTLQNPWSNIRFYADRFASTPPGNEVLAAVVDGELAGTCGLHPSPHDGVFGLGMAVSAGWQGCGLGGRLLDGILQRARARGARRVELGVWEDNERARALYLSRGFVPEGTLRFDGLRDGGHASSLEMALRFGPVGLGTGAEP